MAPFYFSDFREEYGLINNLTDFNEYVWGKLIPYQETILQWESVETEMKKGDKMNI